MIDPGAQALVLLETFPDLISGRVAAAHLESEGIPARLEGEPLGPYPLTVGAMAVTRVWVPAERAEEARLLLGQREDPATFVDVGSADQERPPRPTAPIFWVSLVIVALLLARALYWLF
jgi:hypothetical protein